MNTNRKWYAGLQDDLNKITKNRLVCVSILVLNKISTYDVEEITAGIFFIKHELCPWDNKIIYCLHESSVLCIVIAITPVRLHSDKVRHTQ